ncbi:uncharacterized protein PV07_06411 [Cladophialophora immunda]|uniref:Uncharacterized protein n=1 Tax=Cladophialophora immunda TaxID=569365 RepID=A0A0D2AZF5_9EURO|nr:uncharacterized protein PV07_06411 [Cladophialophora immunda]KIW30692.1 hypothetical protein PV07_06411 [Cladophialophora immunda]OQU99468.1 hypothetical protein CLAIMM_05098 [Cladophialophora immunda]
MTTISQWPTADPGPYARQTIKFRAKADEVARDATSGHCIREGQSVRSRLSELWIAHAVLPDPNVAAFTSQLKVQKAQLRKQGRSDTRPPVLKGWTHEASRRLVHDNAVEIARLGITYIRTFAVQNTATVMLDNSYVAAATLVAEALRSDRAAVDPTDAEWLRLLDEILKSLQVYFSIAIRMRSNPGSAD